jgi:hypothetical protein
MFRNRSRIQHVAAHPANSALMILRAEYKRAQLSNISDGMVAATTINCMASIPEVESKDVN